MASGCGAGSTTGSATRTGRTSATPGLREIAAAAVEAARIADADEFAAPPEAAGGAAPEIDGLADPNFAKAKTEHKVELAKAIERAAREADSRVVAVETVVYADEEERVALASSTGLAGELRGDHGVRLPPGDRRGRRRQADRARVRDGPLAGGARPEEIGREGAERATSLLGAAKPASRTCPVVLDPIVAASFAGFIGGTLCADAVQRGRSPFAGRLGERGRLGGAHPHRRRASTPTGLNSSPFDAEGAPRAERR